MGCQIHDLSRTTLALLVIQLIAYGITFGLLHIKAGPNNAKVQGPMDFFKMASKGNTTVARDTTPLAAAYLTLPAALICSLIGIIELLLLGAPKTYSLMIHAVTNFVNVATGSVAVASLTIFLASQPTKKVTGYLAVYATATGLCYIAHVLSYAIMVLWVCMLKHNLKQRKVPAEPSMTLRPTENAQQTVSKSFSELSVLHNTPKAKAKTSTPSVPESLDDVPLPPKTTDKKPVSIMKKTAKAKKGKGENSAMDHTATFQPDGQINPELLMSTADLEKKLAKEREKDGKGGKGKEKKNTKPKGKGKRVKMKRVRQAGDKKSDGKDDEEFMSLKDEMDDGSEEEESSKKSREGGKTQSEKKKKKSPTKESPKADKSPKSLSSKASKKSEKEKPKKVKSDGSVKTPPLPQSPKHKRESL